MSEFNDDGHCFVCGPQNSAGLHLHFREGADGQGVQAEVVFPAHLQGWRDTVHGGLLATVLDEAMVKAALAQGLTCVTAELTVKYKKPVTTGVRCTVAGSVLEVRGRLITARSVVQDEAGQLLASATGKLMNTPLPTRRMCAD